MPIIKSAKKRMKQAQKRQQYNVAVKSSVKKQTKIVRAEINSGDVKSNEALVLAIAQLDTAVKKGVLHKRTAARKKSRLTKAYNTVAKKPFGTENPGKPGVKKTTKKVVAKKPARKIVTAKKSKANKTTPKKK